MLKLIVKSFFITILIVVPVFANDELSTFHRQGDFDYPEPIGQEAYFATGVSLSNKTYAYFGFNLGSNFTPLKSEITVDTQLESQKKDALGLELGIYSGYGAHIGHWYLGGELNLATGYLKRTIKDTVNSKDIKLDIKQPLIVSFDFIPGFTNISRSVLIYGRLGLIASSSKVEFSETTAESCAGVCSKDNKMVFGFRAGMGIEYFMSDTFSIRTEYIYNRYGKLSGDYVGTTSYVYKIKPFGSHQVNLGLSIHF